MLSASSYAAHAQKRMKQQPPRLAPLSTSNVNYDPYSAPYTYAPSPNAWRPEHSLAVPPAHLSPYPTEWSNPGSEYSRSPNPEASDSRYLPHNAHLAPVLTPNSHHSSADGSVYPASAAMSQGGSQPGSAAYYGRGYLQQQQQMDYLHHSMPQSYDYGSPYITDAAWDSPFHAQPAQ